MTGVALSSLHKFLLYGFIRKDCPRVKEGITLVAQVKSFMAFLVCCNDIVFCLAYDYPMYWSLPVETISFSNEPRIIDGCGGSCAFSCSLVLPYLLL